MSYFSESSPYLTPLSQRRRTVFIGVIGLLVMLLSQLLGGMGISSGLRDSLATAGIILMVVGWWRLNFPGFLGLLRLGQPDLDERQQTAIARANATAYQILATGLILFFAYGSVADLFTRLPRLPESGNSTVWLGVVWVVLSLPTAILAWTEPDISE